MVVKVEVGAGVCVSKVGVVGVVGVFIVVWLGVGVEIGFLTLVEGVLLVSWFLFLTLEAMVVDAEPVKGE